MKEIAKNEYYELSYDETRNWVYWTMKGFWENMDVVPDFDKHWDETQRAAKSGFKIFADLSKLKAMPDDVKKAQEERQQRLMQSGCIKVSCIMESAVTKISLNKVIQESGMQEMLQYFDNATEAESWLSQ